MDFKKVYLGDYSEEGYNDNFIDGKEGRPRNKFKFFKAVHPINLVWNFNNSWETYQRSGDRAYIDGERVRHQMFDDNNKHHSDRNIGGRTMSEVDSYGAAIAYLEKTQEYLTSIRGEIMLRINKNKEMIDNLYKEGWMKEITDKMAGKHNNLLSDSRGLVKVIDMMNEQINSSIKRIAALREVADDK